MDCDAPDPRPDPATPRGPPVRTDPRSKAPASEVGDQPSWNRGGRTMPPRLLAALLCQQMARKPPSASPLSAKLPQILQAESPEQVAASQIGFTSDTIGWN